MKVAQNIKFFIIIQIRDFLFIEKNRKKSSKFSVDRKTRMHVVFQSISYLNLFIYDKQRNYEQAEILLMKTYKNNYKTYEILFILGSLLRFYNIHRIFEYYLNI